ncbi:hypothetical protein AKJ16_DCAP09156 [Drosera capensis]
MVLSGLPVAIGVDLTLSGLRCHKEQCWRHFKEHFKWVPSIAGLVRSEFEKTTAKICEDMGHLLRKMRKEQTVKRCAHVRADQLQQRIRHELGGNPILSGVRSSGFHRKLISTPKMTRQLKQEIGRACAAAFEDFVRFLQPSSYPPDGASSAGGSKPLCEQPPRPEGSNILRV